MKKVFVSLLSALTIGFAARAAAPNIVFIYTDDHAQHAISAYGSQINQTPHIDRLAATGMRFNQSFVANSICGPARATILTGLHSHANGQVANGARFNDALPTYAKMLQSGGYQTAVVGKWHINSDPNGFDYWALSHGYYNPTFKTAEGQEQVTGYTTEVITERGLDWIKKRDPAKPFSLWICHNATHRTWLPGPQYLRRYENDTIPEPSTLFDDYAGKSEGASTAQTRVARDLFPAYDLQLPATGKGILDGASKGRLGRMNAEQRKAWDAVFDPENEAFAAAHLTGEALTRWKYQRYIKNYLRCVDAIDDSVGRVMDFLKENGLEENTILIYSSDQGFFLGDHGWYDKRWMYEPSLRTPLIVRWPGVTKPGSTSEAMVQNIDMAPTFIQMAGLPVPQNMHGASLLPLLQGTPPADWRKSIYYHYQENDGKDRASHMVAAHYGVRTDRYKLIYVYAHNFWELYDLQNDPNELHNLSGKPGMATIEQELKTELRRLRTLYQDKTGPNMPE